jgi:hypothetical protein
MELLNGAAQAQELDAAICIDLRRIFEIPSATEHFSRSAT